MKLFLSALCLVVGASVFTVSAADNYSLWAFSRNCTLNTSATGLNVPGTVVNFPTLVRLGGVSRPLFDFAQARKNGQDIRFAKSDGTHLGYQIEQWDSATGIASLWVKLDTVYGNNATQYFKMFWGKADAADSSKAGAVFDSASGFAGVWHLGEEAAGVGTAGLYKDAVTGINNGTDSLIVTNQSGAIGNGHAFAGDTLNPDFIVIPNVTSILKPATSIVMSAWIKTTTLNTSEIMSMGNGYMLRIGGGRVMVYIEIADTLRVFHEFADGTRINNNRWNLITTVISGSLGQIFINGKLVLASNSMPALSYTSGTKYAANNRFYIGCHGDNEGNFFPGGLDEIRVEHMVRDSNWIKLCYATQRPVPVIPKNLQYATKDTTYPDMIEITPNFPTVDGVVDSFAITPELPSILSFDKFTGIISGVTFGALPKTTFYIRAYNEVGSCDDTISIAIGGDVSIRTNQTRQVSEYRIMYGSKVIARVGSEVLGGTPIKSVVVRLFDLSGRRIGQQVFAPSSQSLAFERAANRTSMGVHLVQLELQYAGGRTVVRTVPVIPLR